MIDETSPELLREKEYNNTVNGIDSLRHYMTNDEFEQYSSEINKRFESLSKKRWRKCKIKNVKGPL
jgi:hypothetical protein